MTDEIANALGLTPLEHIEEAETDDVEIAYGELVDYKGSDQLPDVPAPDEELLNDIDEAKNNIRKLIKHGNEAVADLMDIAAKTNSSASYEVVAKLIKELVNANKEMINTSKEKKYEKEAVPSQHSTNVTNNNLVIGTNELLAMIKGNSN